MHQKKQRDFFESQRDLKPGRLEHGGSESTGKRKLMRPFDRKKPLHIVLRSSKAKGGFSLLAASKKLKIEKIVKQTAQKHQVTLHSYANVGNHLHIVASSPRKEGFQNFLRLIAGLIARLVTGARKGKPFGKFWDHLAYSRVVVGRRALAFVIDYVQANVLEGKYGKVAREYFLGEKEYERGRRFVGLGASSA